MKITVREMRELERLFTSEINGRHRCIHDKRMAAKLKRAGLIFTYEERFQDHLGVMTWTAHGLTHAGRDLYCSNCPDPDKAQEAT